VAERKKERKRLRMKRKEEVEKKLSLIKCLQILCHRNLSQ
jgi:hypothetical protein